MRRVVFFSIVAVVLAGSAWALLGGVPRGDYKTGPTAVAAVTPAVNKSAAGDAVEQSVKQIAAEPVMDEAQRTFLWDVEHHGNVLSEYGFKAWGKFLASSDRQGLSRLLSDGFEGHAPG